MMTHHPTATRLPTYALTPWKRGALLRVSPVIAHTVWLGKPALWVRWLESIRAAWHRLPAAANSGASGAAPCGLADQPGTARNGEQDGGCKICRSAHFEIGAVAAGQEYL